ncbi:replication initiation protein [Persephonella sp. KM09-Lau-8]|uniref:replication initiation protein n=1 Tax=Persephonella sp. KM09-Lau-8 TaxID=1158345 RepID=UPI000495DADC|nr:replication initiation protein [Persephonella sp. KM09-Lau-8]
MEKKISDKDYLGKNPIAKFDNKIIEAIQLIIVDGKGEISSFTPEEHKIFIEAVSRLTVEDDASRHIKIDLREFLREKGVSERNYSYVRKLANSLRTKGFKIKIKEDFEIVVNIFSYTGGEGTRYLIVGFNADLVPFLLKLKGGFTQIPKKEVFKLASSYSIKLYQLLKRFEDTGKRVDKISDLKEKLGIPSERYKSFRDFNKRVLKKAIEDINKLTDIQVSYETVKEYRKVTHIVFYVQKKNEGEETVFQPFEQRWELIRDLRQQYSDFLEGLSFERLNENQVLFLLANLDTSLYPLEIAIDIIKTADKNKALDRPMGFLIRTFQINMEKAKYYELTLTPRKIDKELFAEKLERDKKAPELEQAKEMTEPLVQLLQESLGEKTLSFLREPLLDALLDKTEGVVYIPAPDEVYKEWLEKNYLQSIKEFLRENFDVSDVVVEVVSKESDGQ